MDSADPLLAELTVRDLWADVGRAMVAHVGAKGKPWLGHSGFLDEIGLRALRFDYMHRGFEAAFRTSPPAEP